MKTLNASVSSFSLRNTTVKKVYLKNPNNEQVKFSKNLNKIFGFNSYLIQTTNEGNFSIPKNINDVNSLYIFLQIKERDRLHLNILKAAPNK